MAILTQFFCKCIFYIHPEAAKKNWPTFFVFYPPKRDVFFIGGAWLARFPGLRVYPQFWKSDQPGTPCKKNVSFGGVKHKKSGPNNFFRQVHTYKKYILQKKWSKTVIPALSSGQKNLHPAIWGCHHQLDDLHRNPNANNRDHLVGQRTNDSTASLDKRGHKKLGLSEMRLLRP